MYIKNIGIFIKKGVNSKSLPVVFKSLIICILYFMGQLF